MKHLLATRLDPSAAFPTFWKATVNVPMLGVSVVNSDGIVVFANRAFRRMVFHDTEFNPASHHVAALEGDGFANEVGSVVRETLETGEPVVVFYTRYGVRLESVVTAWRPNGPTDSTVVSLIFTKECACAPESAVGMRCFESDYNSWGELDQLTDRQLEVLAALRAGYSQRDTAELLGIAPKTVETHRDQLVHRLGLKSTIEAIRLADRAGLTLDNSRKKRHRERPWQQIRDAQASETASQHGEDGVGVA